jgi:hypothetical protein
VTLNGFFAFISVKNKNNSGELKDKYPIYFCFARSVFISLVTNWKCFLGDVDIFAAIWIFAFETHGGLSVESMELNGKLFIIASQSM